MAVSFRPAQVEYTIGDFDTEDEAAKAYDIEAIKRGKLRYLNFVYKGLNDQAPQEKKKRQKSRRRGGGSADAGTAKRRKAAEAADSQGASTVPPPSPQPSASSDQVLPTSRASAAAVGSVLHIPKEANPNLKARPKVRNRNGKRYARINEAMGVGALEPRFSGRGDGEPDSADLFDTSRGLADSSAHEAMYSVGTGPVLPKVPSNPYFRMAHAAPSRGGQALVAAGEALAARGPHHLPLTAQPSAPLTAWGRMSTQAQQLANSFAHGSMPAVPDFCEAKATSGGATEESSQRDRKLVSELLLFLTDQRIRVVLSDDMRRKLKYVIITGGPQVLTLVGAGVEVFRLTDDIHELLDTLGQAYRVWCNAALALGLFGDYVPYVFSSPSATQGHPGPPHSTVRDESAGNGTDPERLASAASDARQASPLTPVHGTGHPVAAFGVSGSSRAPGGSSASPIGAPASAAVGDA